MYASIKACRSSSSEYSKYKYARIVFGTPGSGGAPPIGERPITNSPIALEYGSGRPDNELYSPNTGVSSSFRDFDYVGVAPEHRMIEIIRYPGAGFG